MPQFSGWREVVRQVARALRSTPARRMGAVPVIEWMRRLVTGGRESVAALGLGLLSVVFMLPSLVLGPEFTDAGPDTHLDLRAVAPLLKAMSPVMAPLAVLVCLTGVVVAVIALRPRGILLAIAGFALSATSLAVLLVAVTGCRCWS